jgi:two-component system response regulator (stage 0 sporulation protein A)
MEYKTKILLVDDNIEVTNSISSYFDSTNSFTVTGQAGDAIEAIKLIELQAPDIIIMDLIMPNADGFYLLEYLSKTKFKKQPGIIILSCLSQESVISRASSLGADYYIVKPFNMQVLYNRVVEVCSKQYTISTSKSYRSKSVEERVNEIFSTLGIPRYTKGHKYLLDCVVSAAADPDKLKNLNREIYRGISLTNDTSIDTVERDIRHTITLMWDSYAKKGEAIYGLQPDEKPSNKKFIKRISEQLNIEGYR